MTTVFSPVPVAAVPQDLAGGPLQWLQVHRGAAAMAALLAFAGPVIFLTGALSVMRVPSAGGIARLALWWVLYGGALWCLLLLAGYVALRATRRLTPFPAAAVWALAACSAAALATLVTAGRAPALIEQGLVRSAATMHVHGFTVSLAMALLYFAHLRSSGEYARAAARLAVAQTAQRDARRRTAEASLRALQARIDPRLLFGMLDAVRRLYERDAAEAERLLDELIVFLRAALPRLRDASSSLAREVELARAFVALRALAERKPVAMHAEIAADVRHARFPPGVLVPLLEHVAGGNPPRLTAIRAGDCCRLTLSLDAPPPGEAFARVRSLLSSLHGPAGRLETGVAADPAAVIVDVPYELA